MSEVIVDSTRSPETINVGDREKFLLRLNRAATKVDLSDHSLVVITAEEPMLALHESVAGVFNVMDCHVVVEIAHLVSIGSKLD